MHIMAIDTSGLQCVVALFNPQTFEFHENRNFEKNKHSESLFPLICEVLESAKISFSHVTDIAVIVGPGSFTGLRVALSAAEGFKLSSNVAVHGISLLELQAFEMYRCKKGDEPFVSMVAAQKSDTVHYQLFSSSLLPMSGVITCKLNDAPDAAKNLENCARYNAESSKNIGEYLVYKLENKLPTTKLLPIYTNYYA